MTAVPAEGAFTGRLRRLALLLAYDGTAFKGWQRQAGKARTVQAVLESAISKVLGQEIRVDGAGRTDSGVHARGQVASFSATTGRSAASILESLAAALPEDLACESCADVDGRFHARLSATGKAYRYLLDRGKSRDPFLARYALHVGADLDIGAMRAAAALLVGRRDFASFTNLKEKEKSFVRDLRKAWVREDGRLVELRFEADGFLYNQARIMAGVLLDVGLGRMRPGKVAEIAAARRRAQASGALDGRGLYLEEVFYPEPAPFPKP